MPVSPQMPPPPIPGPPEVIGQAKGRCEVDRSASVAIDIVPEVKVAGLGGEILGVAPESVLLLMHLQS